MTASPLRPCDLIRKLKAAFPGQWVEHDSIAWDLRFIFQLIEMDGFRFKINIALFANLNGDAREGQRVLYLVLEWRKKFILSCPSDLNPDIEESIAAFNPIFPISQFVSDAQKILYPEKVGVRELCLSQEKPR